MIDSGDKPFAGSRLFDEPFGNLPPSPIIAFRLGSGRGDSLQKVGLGGEDLEAGEAGGQRLWSNVTAVFPFMTTPSCLWHNWF